MFLTRYLYAEDDVRVSFVDALLNKKTKEALWWFFEYYYSLDSNKEKSWQLIFEAYYNYYAIYYPKMESYIYQRYQMWRLGETVEIDAHNDGNFMEIPINEIKHLVVIIKNLSIRTSSYDVFVLQQTCKQIAKLEGSRKKYKFRKNSVAKERKWLTDLNFTDEFYSFLWALHNRDWLNICYSIEFFAKNKLDFDKIHYEVVKYFTEVESIYGMEYSKAQKLWKKAKDHYKEEKHILLAIVAYLCKFSKDREVPSDVCVNRMYALETKEEIDCIHEWNDDSSMKAWQILRQKRIYRVSRNVVCFSNLSRFQESVDLYSILRLHWMEYCYHCPLWNKRFQKYGASLLVGDYGGCGARLTFTSDDGEEEWMEKYNYEPDEQPLIVQEMSLIWDEGEDGGEDEVDGGEDRGKDEMDEVDEIAEKMSTNLKVSQASEGCGEGEKDELVEVATEMFKKLNVCDVDFTKWVNRHQKVQDKLLYWPNLNSGYII